MHRLHNLSFYRFLPLGDAVALRALRAELRELCARLELKGTLLIAPEGVNGMLSGPPAAIAEFQSFAAARFGIPADVFKQTEDIEGSFGRMLVKVKREIIPIGADVRPDRKTAPRVSAAQLREWLDQGRPVTLVDTRNDYEVGVGTFKGAERLDLKTSREFAAKAVARHEAWAKAAQNGPIVTFCTGGIRCEKASAVLLDLGLDNVYQLDGGILRYFAQNGAAHYEGNCFVFDWREAVTGELEPVARSSDPAADFGRHRRAKPE